MTKPRRITMFMLTATIAAGCSSASNEPLSSDPAEAVVSVEKGQTFELRPGQTARVGSEGLLVGFRGVSNDSRCPVDVTCVWAGDAELNVPVTIGRMAWTSLTLHTGIEPRSATFRDYKVVVVGLSPDPRSTASIPSQNYVVTLRVE